MLASRSPNAGMDGAQAGTPPTAKEIAAAEAARLRRGFATSEEAAAAAPPPPAKLPTGMPEPTAADVTYLTFEALPPVVETRPPAKRANPDAGEDDAAQETACYPSVDDACQATLALLASPTWTDVVAGLNLLRRIAKYHPQHAAALLVAATPLLTKSLKSPRSGIIKTAVLASNDLCATLGPAVVPHLGDGNNNNPGWLLQLLVKAGSNDKRFVIEAAQDAIRSLAAALAPNRAAGDTLLDVLKAHAKHRNPKVRANTLLAMHALCAARFANPPPPRSPSSPVAAGTPAAAVATLVVHADEAEDCGEFFVRLDAPAQSPAPANPPPLSLEQVTALLAVAGAQLTDKQKEARDSARALLDILRESFALCEGGTDDEWDALCRKTLEATTANAVLKALAK